MRYYLDFEKPIEELELKIEELRRLSDGKDLDITSELKKLEKKVKDLRSDIFSNLTRWQKTQIARHPERPYTLDYIGMIVEDFVELHGDRRFSDDPALVGGIGRLKGSYEACREVQKTDSYIYRHPRGIPRHRGRGEGAGRGNSI